jgi:hypothetical protein
MENSENSEKLPEIEPFSLWRSEILARLDMAQIELTEAVADRDEAQLKCREIAASKAIVSRAFALIPPHKLAGPLAARRHGWDAEQDRAVADLSRAANRVAGLMREILELQLSLDQLDQIMPQDVSDAA